MSEKKEKPFEFPQIILSQVEEHSPGGFILITINPETGQPQPFLKFDNGISALGLIAFIKNWAAGLSDSSDAQIYNSFAPDDDDDDGDCPG